MAIFARVLIADVLRAHETGPLRSTELEERLGWAAKASLRVACGELCQLGALERRGEPSIATGLTPAGHDLLGLADVLEHWLAGSPFGPLELADAPARGTIRALVAGWDSTIVRALAERPRSLAELSSAIPAHSYPALKRRSAKLRTATLVESDGGSARSPEQVATPFLRQAIGPLSVAARWDGMHTPEAELEEEDLQAALLLSLPLIDLPPQASGGCVLVARARRPRLAGSDEASPTVIRVEIEKGEVAAVNSDVDPAPSTWALGSTDAWLDAIVENKLDRLRLRGPDLNLARSIVSGLNRALVG